MIALFVYFIVSYLAAVHVIMINAVRTYPGLQFNSDTKWHNLRLISWTLIVSLILPFIVLYVVIVD